MDIGENGVVTSTDDGSGVDIREWCALNSNVDGTGNPGRSETISFMFGLVELS